MTRRHDDQGATGDVDLTTVPAGIHEEIDEAPARESRAPRTLKGAAILSARLITGLVGLATAAAVVAVAVLLPPPSQTGEAPSILITPIAAQQERVCAGPLLRLGDDTGAQATTASALGSPRVTSGASEGDVDEILASDPVGGDAVAAEIITLPEEGEGEQELLAASQSQTVAQGDFVGAAAAECLEPRDDTWLVGGATTTGRTTLLTVVNPGDVTATVDITVYSDTGVTTAPGTKGIAIPAGQQRIYSLAGLAPGLASPVVRVESEGALVVATLQQSTVRTLEPGGLDIVTASTAPATELTIPGVVFPDRGDLENAIQGEDYLDLNPALRMYVPGERQAHVLITLVPVTASGASTTPDAVDISVTLDPGRVTELPVGDFESRRYVAVITSDEPLVAGMRVATATEDGENDFMWLPTVDPIEERALIPVAAGANPVLTLHNASDEASEVTLRDGDDETEVEIAPNGATAVRVTQNRVYELDGFDQLHVNVSYVGDGLITAHSVSPRAPASTPIRIYP